MTEEDWIALDKKVRAYADWMAKRELRCKVTGNPCCTDTWMVGAPCQCPSCREYLLRDPHAAA